MRKSGLLLLQLLQRLLVPVFIVWLVLFFLFGGGMTFVISGGHSTTPVDGTFITPAALPLIIYLPFAVSRVNQLGLQMSLGQHTIRRVLCLAPIVLAVLNQVMMGLWAFTLRLRGGESSALLRELGYRGAWSFGAGLANILVEAGAIAVIGGLVLIMLCAFARFGSWALGTVLVVAFLLNQFGAPLGKAILAMGPSDSGAAQMTRRILNGSFTQMVPVSQASPWLAVGTAMGLLVLVTLILRWALRWMGNGHTTWFA